MFQRSTGGGLDRSQTSHEGAGAAEEVKQMRKNYLEGVALAFGAKDEYVQENIEKWMHKAEARRWDVLWARFKNGGEHAIDPKEMLDFTEIAEELLKDLHVDSRVKKTEEQLAIIGFYALALLYREPKDRLFTKTIQEKLQAWNVGEEGMRKFRKRIERHES